MYTSLGRINVASFTEILKQFGLPIGLDFIDVCKANDLDTFREFVSGKTVLPTVMVCLLVSGTMELLYKKFMPQGCRYH